MRVNVKVDELACHGPLLSYAQNPNNRAEGARHVVHRREAAARARAVLRVAFDERQTDRDLLGPHFSRLID